jgi:hypothetical protein
LDRHRRIGVVLLHDDDQPVREHYPGRERLRVRAGAARNGRAGGAPAAASAAGSPPAAHAPRSRRRRRAGTAARAVPGSAPALGGSARERLVGPLCARRRSGTRPRARFKSAALTLSIRSM